MILDLDNFKHDQRHPRSPLRRSGAARGRRCVARRDPPGRRRRAHRRATSSALILPGGDWQHNAFAIAERARDAVAAIPVRRASSSPAPAGIARLPARRRGPATLVQLADSALTWAKRGGKRRTRRFDADHAPATSGASASGPRSSELLAHERPITPSSSPSSASPPGGSSASRRSPASRPRGAAPDVWFAQAHDPGSAPSSRRPRSGRRSRRRATARRPPGDQRQPVGARLADVVQRAGRRPRPAS